MSIHEDRIYYSPTDRKHATALYGTRRDVSTPSIFGYSMGLVSIVRTVHGSFSTVSAPNGTQIVALILPIFTTQ